MALLLLNLLRPLLLLELSLLLLLLDLSLLLLLQSLLVLQLLFLSLLRLKVRASLLRLVLPDFGLIWPYLLVVDAILKLSPILRCLARLTRANLVCLTGTGLI